MGKKSWSFSLTHADLSAFRNAIKSVDEAMLEIGCVLVPGSFNLDPDSITTLPNTSTTTPSWAGFRVYELNDAMSATDPVYIKISFGRGQWSTNSSNTPFAQTMVEVFLNINMATGSPTDISKRILNGATTGKISGNGSGVSVPDAAPYGWACKKEGYLGFAFLPRQIYVSGTTSGECTSYLFFVLRREYDSEGGFTGVSLFHRTSFSLPNSVYQRGLSSSGVSVIQVANTALSCSYVGKAPTDPTIQTNPRCSDFYGGQQYATVGGGLLIQCPRSIGPGMPQVPQMGFYSTAAANTGDMVDIEVGGQTRTYMLVGPNWGFVPAPGWSDVPVGVGASYPAEFGVAIEWER